MSQPEVPKSLPALRHEYQPYDRLPAFDHGFAAYTLGFGNSKNPYDDDSVDAQAWDRGLECGSRWTRILEGRNQ